MIVINSSDRRFGIPGADFVFGVEADAGSETKRFQCPRYVGNDLDIAGSFVRINYRNANGEIDSYLVDDVTIDGDNVTFSWVLSPKVVMYKGSIKFVMCVVGPDTKVKWHTTLGAGRVLEGLEPDSAIVEEGTADVVAQLIAMVEAQTAAVETTGAEWVANVKSEGATQVNNVRTAAETAEAASVAEIEAKGVNTLASIPEDYTALSRAVRGHAGAIVCEAEGETITLSDSSNLPMQGLRIFGRSTQDGTPTPEAPVEIVSVEAPTVSVCGKNLVRFSTASLTESGITATKTDDGGVLINGTATADVCFCFDFHNRICYQGVELIASLDNAMTGVEMVVGYIREDATFLEGLTVVKTAEAAFVYPAEAYKTRKYILVKSGMACNNLTVYPMIRPATAVTGFEAPTAQAWAVTTTHTLPGIPVTSGGNYTDSNGQQWICDEVDLERGVYIKRIGTVALTGGESWSLNSQGTEAGVNAYHFIKNGDLMLHSRGYCTHFKNGGGWSEGLPSTLNTFWVANDHVAVFKTDGTQPLQEFKDWIRAAHEGGNPVTLHYVSKSPVETPLSETELAAYRALHTNKPNTTILNDAGAHMAVAYAADTKLYIDNKIAALTA